MSEVGYVSSMLVTVVSLLIATVSPNNASQRNSGNRYHGINTIKVALSYQATVPAETGSGSSCSSIWRHQQKQK